MSETSTARPAARPIAGDLFKAVARHPIEGTKRRKLLALIAAFADAGEPSPRARDLAHRLGLPEGHPGIRKLDRLLRRLADDGLLEVGWHQGEGRRNLYRITLPP